MISGIDVSKWQCPMEYATAYSQGARFAAVRATVGDYYADPKFIENWNGLKSAGFYVTAYLVTAPKSGDREISVDAHLNLFFNVVNGLVPDLPWVLDAELDRGASNAKITALNLGVATGLWSSQDRSPLIYTRQTFWDYFVNHNEMWGECDLWAARYKSGLVSPWSDGAHTFRDWNTWKIWQYTSSGNGIAYGASSLEIDLDWFNGTQEDLIEYAGGQTAPYSLEEKVDILWREACLHGWNLQR